jgi:phage shock protein PspC (stress-responsive transcriptional regulator)
MKKVININFQGRVIPIEETAYDMLKQYVESLRVFFANEEGRDEIINDIEGRIAELFGESLKKGSTCITDIEVTNIINSMGRPEDFEAEEAKVHSQLGGETGKGTYSTAEPRTTTSRGRLYRNLNDKLLGGVCSGVASYLRVDPTIVRLLFAVITFGGFGLGFLIYIVLWIVLPSKPLDVNLKKRLYRNPDDRIIGGVAGGLGAYFNVQVWALRLIFALPLILGIISSIFQNAFYHFNPFPTIVFSSFGSTLFIIYIILWIVIPEANSATEKMEMRGEKVDLYSIKNSFKEEMEGLKKSAEKFGNEFKQKATEWGEEVKVTASERSQAFATEAAPIMRKTGSRFLNAIGILFKAFFLFISGIIVFALLMALLGIMIGGVSVFPLKNFLLQGFTQNFLAWTTLLLFLGVPVIAFITWIVRRVIGVKSKNKYIGFTFGGLWTIGLITAILLAASITNDFNTYAREKQDYTLVQPATGKMIVKVPEGNFKVYGKWFNMDGLLSMTDDSIYLNRVRLRIVKSPDSAYHAYAVKSSNGGEEGEALNNAKAITYDVNQQDSLMYLSRGFALKKGTRFRNQGVIVTLQVPVGKRIEVDRSVSRRLNWFHMDNRGGDWDDEWDNNENWDSNVEYIMTVGGLERVNKIDEENPEDAMDEFRKSREQIQKEKEKKLKELQEIDKELKKASDSTYRYKPGSVKVETEDQEEETEITTETRTANLKGDFTLRPMTSFLRFIE